jgi:hypothetical protein
VHQVKELKRKYGDYTNYQRHLENRKQHQAHLGLIDPDHQQIEDK